MRYVVAAVSYLVAWQGSANLFRGLLCQDGYIRLVLGHFELPRYTLITIVRALYYFSDH